MSNIRVIEGDFRGGSAKYAIVVARFNSFIVDKLLEGAIDALLRHGVNESDITVVKAPGAFELPVLTKNVLDAGNYDAVIALGEIVHGSGYMDIEELTAIYHKGIKNGINANFVALENDQLIGFRLTYAAGQWPHDQWCTVDQWGVDFNDVCYFKSKTFLHS